MRYAIFALVALALAAMLAHAATRRLLPLSTALHSSSAADDNAHATPYVMAFSTVPDQAVATAISNALVTERLAACVNTVPGLKSTYCWQGNVNVDDELLLIIKTRAQLIPQLKKRLVQLHPYDVPELIVHSIVDGHAPYLKWIAHSTKASSSD
ncbi:Divalent-cation tolerance protein CutA [Gracilariopsis chorda]|uniref:Divalent-cation tolerance protein CutA n=1 Tax=Gracilariopsis chorda TaxID=448386 RepID=A0A2V3IVM2_9FLOR|nr:Divalent-cation tolerance protein CutA [Gracilariopsis chorda]|eukprot:PXF46139.1 Divalent-cation tolerance protein CutA [Gracilariopsis chorda]